MKLRHTTLRTNLPSIRKGGLLTSKSQGKMAAVWLHHPDRTAWAFLHVVKRHGGRVEDVVTIEVEVPAAWLRWIGVRGLAFTQQDIPPRCLKDVLGFRVVAERPSRKDGAA